MCGICGFTWEDKKLLKQMADRIRHRGPDDEGYYTDKNISLANRRLSIIDLSKKGKQPIFNEDKSICVVFNGEIYNFQEIKQELEKKRHRFYSNTDTEVIVHSYEEYGEKCLEYFNGMFAFALWDSKKKKLFIARDRHGIKPLYYTLLKDKLIFASEIKSILLNEEVKRIVNYEALHYFLSFRCNSTQETMFKGIYKLPPAHYLTYSNDKLQIKKYWEQKFEPLYKSEDYYAKLILKKLEESENLELKTSLSEKEEILETIEANPDGKTVAAMDVLVPSVGEIIGGSQREDQLDLLVKRMDELSLPKEDYWWYLDLRKYGSVPHAGFGLGLERLVLFATGMENIREVIPFPRYPKHAEF